MSALRDRPSSDAAEAHRRRMLDESDVLLDLIERLRLADRTVCPPGLAEAVRALQLRLGRIEAGRPRTVRAAQNLVFSVQARLMASNPRLPRPSPQPERPVGQPRVAVLRHGGAWKFLALPPPPASAEAAEAAEAARWRQLVDATVQRALDRWAAAQDRAVRAARVRDGAVAAVHRAAAAWRNYWELRCEAESLLSRPGRGSSDPLALSAAPPIRLDVGLRSSPPQVARARGSDAPSQTPSCRVSTSAALATEQASGLYTIHLDAAGGHR